MRTLYCDSKRGYRKKCLSFCSVGLFLLILVFVNIEFTEAAIYSKWRIPSNLPRYRSNQNSVSMQDKDIFHINTEDQFERKEGLLLEEELQKKQQIFAFPSLMNPVTALVNFMQNMVSHMLLPFTMALHS